MRIRMRSPIRTFADEQHGDAVLVKHSTSRAQIAAAHQGKAIRVCLGPRKGKTNTEMDECSYGFFPTCFG